MSTLAGTPSLDTTPLVLEPAYGSFIDGRFDTPSAPQSEAIDALTGTAIAALAVASRGDLERAVAAARVACVERWQPLAPAARAMALFRLAALLGERAAEPAILQTRCTGMPIRISRSREVPHGADVLFSQAGWADKLRYACDGGDLAAPLGVVAAAITGERALRAAVAVAAPALAAGNTVVLICAPQAALVALWLAELTVHAALPSGAFNVVIGDAALVAALPTIAGIDRIVAPDAPDASIAIVFADAPLDCAVDGIAACGSLLVLVQESIAEPFAERLRERIATLRVGDPRDKNTDLGPLPQRPGEPFGVRYPVPTVVADAAPAMAIVREPLAPGTFVLMTFRTADEAIDRAGGLSPRATSIWTADGAKANFCAERLSSAYVGQSTSEHDDPSAAPDGRAAVRRYLTHASAR